MTCQPRRHLVVKTTFCKCFNASHKHTFRSKSKGYKLNLEKGFSHRYVGRSSSSGKPTKPRVWKVLTNRKRMFDQPGILCAKLLAASLWLWWCDYLRNVCCFVFNVIGARYTRHILRIANGWFWLFLGSTSGWLKLFLEARVQFMANKIVCGMRAAIEEDGSFML